MPNRRQDYINIQRRIFKLLKEHYFNKQLPYYPEPPMTNQRLADMLGVSEKTVRRHKQNITPKQWENIQSIDLTEAWHKIASLYT